MQYHVDCNFCLNIPITIFMFFISEKEEGHLIIYSYNLKIERYDFFIMN